MQIFKFGGASVKDANSIRNVGEIISKYNEGKLLIVISAMGKTTNYLERIWTAYHQQSNDLADLLGVLKQQNDAVISDLFVDPNSINEKLNKVYSELKSILAQKPVVNIDFLYDQIVSVGEIFSTLLVSEYLNEIGCINKWVNVKTCIKTDTNYREGIVDWGKTKTSINNVINSIEENIVITQGFLGATPENHTTTLGREGSDYTGSIFATCLNAEKLTIWKDVPGVLNADPRFVSPTQKLDALSFQQANELTFYGAKVIHPKTLSPLKNANIPLEVRSFVEPNNEGTIISSQATAEINLPPIVIFNREQVKITVSRKDDQLLFEKDIAKVYTAFSNQYLQVNLSHRSAYNVWFAVDNQRFKIDPVVEELKAAYNIDVNDKGLEVLTFKHHTQKFVEKILADKKVVCKAFTGDLMKILVNA